MKKFVDSRGKEFIGRIAAVRKLVRSGRTEEAQILRAGLSSDGWIQHPLLPAGWWVNKWFVGLRKAVSELSLGKYTLEEVKNLHRMLEEFASKSWIVSTVWKLGGRALPEGWRSQQ